MSCKEYKTRITKKPFIGERNDSTLEERWQEITKARARLAADTSKDTKTYIIPIIRYLVLLHRCQGEESVASVGRQTEERGCKVHVHFPDVTKCS